MNTEKPLDVYGRLEDVEAIIQGCHDRGLKILFDLVINHTSSEAASGTLAEFRMLIQLYRSTSLVQRIQKVARQPIQKVSRTVSSSCGDT